VILLMMRFTTGRLPRRGYNSPLPSISFHVERVNEIEVADVCSGGFVGNIHRMREREVPYGERLELCIAARTLSGTRGIAAKDMLQVFRFRVPAGLTITRGFCVSTYAFKP